MPQRRNQHRPGPSGHRATPYAHAPNTRRRSANPTRYETHQLTPTGNRKPHRGRTAHPHGEEELHPQRKTPRTPTPSPPPHPQSRPPTPATARATSQAPEEQEGAATGPGARGKNPQRARDQSTGPLGGRPRGHPPDPAAQAAHPDPHSTGPASGPAPNRTPQQPASHTQTRTPQHDKGRTNGHRPTTAQHEAARHTAPQRTTMQHTTTRHPKTRHTTAGRGATRHSAAHHGTTGRSTARHSTTHRDTAWASRTQHGETWHDTAQRTTAHHNTKARDTNRGSNPTKLPHAPEGAAPAHHAPARRHRAPGNDGGGTHTQTAARNLSPAPRGLRHTGKASPQPLTQGLRKPPGATAQPADPKPNPASRATGPSVYITQPTHGAGARPNKAQAPTATRLTTPNADQCVHQPREGRGRNRQTPPKRKKKGGGHVKSPQPRNCPPTRGGQTAQPDGTEDRTPRRNTGGPPSQNWRHPTESSGPPEDRTHRTCRHTPRWGGDGKITTRRRSPNERGRGDGEHETQDRDSQRRTPQSHDTTRHDTPPPQKKNKTKGEGGEKLHPEQHSHTPTPQAAPQKVTGNERGAHKRPPTPAPKPGKNRRADKIQTHTHTHHPARNGGVQAGHTHQHTHTPTPQPRVAGHSRDPSPTHTPTAHTPARKDRVQAGRAHKHTHD